MGGHNPHQELLKQTRKLVGKWEPTGLLDDIDDSTKKQGMAVLLENQATQLIKEASATGTGGNKEEWSGVALPLVRRIFGELSAQEFVSVQPMNLPSGLIFFLDFKYGSLLIKPTITADTQMYLVILQVLVMLVVVCMVLVNLDIQLTINL